MPLDVAELIERLRESKSFGLVDPSVWHDLTLRLGHVRLAAGEVLFQQGDAGGAIYVVLAGRLAAYNVEDDGREVALGEMVAGATVGEIQVLTGATRTATVRAVLPSELARIPTEVFDELLRRSPAMRREMLALHERRLHRSQLADVLPRLFGPLDEAAMTELWSFGRWREFHRGDTLIRQGDPGDRCYLLLRGRLAAVAEDAEGRETVLGEVSQGEPVGEMALLTGRPYSASVRAIRDSRVVELSRQEFEQIVARYPQVLKAMTRTLVHRLSRHTPARRGDDDRATVAILPLGGIPATDFTATDFTARLAAALEAFGSTLHVNAELLTDTLGFRTTAAQTPDDPAALRLAAWLDEQELRFRFLICQSDGVRTAWTGRCLRQADRILLVAEAGTTPDAAAVKSLLSSSISWDDVAPRTTLVLVHPDGDGRPRATGRWLDALGLDRHLHLRRRDAGDFARLARSIAGRAVSVVLGGGGARAFAHIGVVRALREAGVEIDGIGGTSAGSLIAAQVAMGWDAETMLERNREIFVEGNPYRDLTLPFVSILSGRRTRALLEVAFSDLEIEDLWLSWFAVSANLTTAQQVIHRRGMVGPAVFASMAVPGVVAPAVSAGELLVDGGLLNNLPGDVARRLWGGRVITVDVSSETEKRFTSATPELPSASSILKRRLSPFGDRVEVPGILEILVRSSLLGSVQNTAAARAEADLFLKPPVGKFGMFNMRALDQLAEVGYRYARRRLEDWDGV